MEDLRRYYAHFHRVLLELLLELEARETVWWLTDKQGHIPKPEGEANTYRKALYVLEELEPYRKRLLELEQVRQTVLALAIPKPVGVLMPVAVEGLREVVFSKTVSWSSHAYEKAKIISKLSGALGLARGNLSTFQLYATTDDRRRDALEREIHTLEVDLERLRTHPENVFRERAKTEKHTARLYPQDGRGEISMVYIRDVGLVIAGKGLTNAGRVRPSASEHRRSDKLTGKLEPLLVYGNYEIYAEREWNEVKKQTAREN
jgi:hypothetical protein